MDLEIVAECGDRKLCLSHIHDDCARQLAPNVSEGNLAESTDLIVSIERTIATVLINRPDQRNAISFAMWERLETVFNSLSNNPSVKVVILKGAGDRAFSAGADIRDFEQTRSTPEKANSYRNQLERTCKAFWDLDVPTVAQIHGYCIGAGFELALQADIRFASDDVQMGIPAARMGLAITHGFVSRLGELVGIGNASYLLLSGRLISSDEALRMGLVSSVCVGDELSIRVNQLVDEVIELSSNSHRLHKNVLRDLHDYGSPSMTPLERLRLPENAAQGPDFREAVRAFMEKRRPNFGS